MLTVMEHIVELLHFSQPGVIANESHMAEFHIWCSNQMCLYIVEKSQKSIYQWTSVEVEAIFNFALLWQSFKEHKSIKLH